MGKKKRGHPDVEEILNRAWCYYCERDFEDLKLLISHQKAKHFKCDKCGRRLNTAGGLSVHMNQVHKESLTQVENALPNRQNLDVEIFGMEGIPEEVLQQHKQRIIQNYYQAQADRYAATGNPPPGQNGSRPAKKLKFETPEELKKRLAEFIRLKRAGVLAPNGQPTVRDGQSPAQSQPPRSASTGTPTGLPQRPGQGGWQGGNNASTIDELVSSGGAVGSAGPKDDIDSMIRAAEAGAAKPAEEKKASKKDKDKNMRLVYDDELSPEERMAQMPRYAVYAPTAAAGA